MKGREGFAPWSGGYGVQDAKLTSDVSTATLSWSGSMRGQISSDIADVSPSRLLLPLRFNIGTHIPEPARVVVGVVVLWW